MPRIALALLLLVSACGHGPGRFVAPFDTGQQVHFIVGIKEPPLNPVEIEAVCTAGTYSVKGPVRTLASGPFKGFEVATLEVPTGNYTLSIWDERTQAAGSTETRVGQETWAVLRLDPKTLKGSLKVFEEDPFDYVGRWQPLLRVPD